MWNSFRLSLHRLLVLAVLVLAVAGCSIALPAQPTPTPAAPADTGPAPVSGGSVGDQLAQLAAGAQAATVAAPAEPNATPEVTAAAPADQGAPVAPATAAATRTRRPTATRAAAVQATKRPMATPAANPTRTPRATRTPADNLRTVTLANLPPEARQTIRLIQQGGPFPYRQDGVTFQNREGRLPKRPAGYYKEYTVVTPGSPDRGARRVIAGEGGELYYTDNHYDTFKRVILP